MIVISDDNKVRNGGRSLGARVESSSYLTIKRHTKKSRQASVNTESASMRGVTEDLKREWGIQ